MCWSDDHLPEVTNETLILNIGRVEEVVAHQVSGKARNISIGG
jgi:hypothetical protein